MIVERVFRPRLYIVAWSVAVALLLAACGGGGGENGGETTESAGRMIEHAMGETEVPENPQRVVVLDTGELDSAMTLGIKPVGAVEAIEGAGYPSYLEGTEGIENVGTIEQPNLEKIASLEPDLILSSKLRHEQIYDQLSQIAPTVFTETTGVTWKENFELHAEALDRVEDGEIVKEEYQARVDEFSQAIGDNPPEVSVVRFLPGDTRIYQKESFIGTVLEDAGLPRPESQDVEDFAIMNASAELIPEMGGDVIFVTTYGPEEESTKQEITSDPLWQQLEAVQQGAVYEVSDDLWMLGIGYTAANGVIDDLSRYLLGEEATTGMATGATTGTSKATTGTATEMTVESTS
jgi:iron complex transport system substrate-binding protein